MMIIPPQGDAALDEFVQGLLRFKRACCVSSNRELVKLAPEVIEQHKELQLCHLTAPVLSDVLARKRRRPPRWEWVATFVLTCLYVHERSGAELDFDGPVSLQDWYEHYQAMLDRRGGARPVGDAPADHGDDASDDGMSEDDATGHDVGEDELSGDDADGAPPGDARAFDGQGSVPADGPVSAFPLEPPGPPAVTAPSMLPFQILRWQELHDAALEDWMYRLRRQQSRAHRRYFELLGQHGVDLLMAAEGAARDREAACRLGILLLCHDRPNEGMAWLRSAAKDGDEPAKILVNAAPSRRREMAAELAYEFTLPGYAQDHPGAERRPTNAEVYYRAATAAGHTGATVRLGLIFEARGEFAAALYTFAQAAERCHPDGIRHFDRLNAQIARDPDTLLPDDLSPDP